MSFHSRFLTILTVTGIAAAIYKNFSKQITQRDKAISNTTLNRWETDGGNLPPTSTPTSEENSDNKKLN